jgi:multicomponent Na+:H+ antiporter subunit G
MSPLEWFSAALLLAGAFFFMAGTAGLLRFPDVFSRLHALTKADNVGLGFIVAGLALQAENAAVAGKLLLIWLLALVASSTSCYMIAGRALERSGPDTGSEDA